MTTLQQLAEEIGATPAEIVEYLGHIGVPDLNGWQNNWQIHNSEARDVREHWTTDPTPRYQWEVTEGDGPWQQDTRDKHDPSL